MNLITTTGLTAADRLDMELVERKGAGHPDTLAALHQAGDRTSLWNPLGSGRFTETGS